VFSRRTRGKCLSSERICLGWQPQLQLAGSLAPCCCVAWGLEDNLTRKASLADPLQITEWIVAGPVNILIGLWVGASIPLSFALLLAVITGFFGYGLSLALYVVALRDLGAARTGAYFSIAPFLGAVVSVVALGENVTWALFAAGALMGLGIWLHVTERHEHEHIHSPMAHVHPHVHDEHHQHDHGPDDHWASRTPIGMSMIAKAPRRCTGHACSCRPPCIRQRLLPVTAGVAGSKSFNFTGSKTLFCEVVLALIVASIR
jgi:EamA-like transporter family